MDFLEFIRKVHEERKQRRVQKGGPGSGNWGHAGREGKRGGSLPRSKAMSRRTGKDWEKRQTEARKKGEREKEFFKELMAGKTKEQIKWWKKWGKRKGTLTNPQAILEAAEVGDHDALRNMDKKVLRQVRNDLLLRNKPELVRILGEALGERSPVSAVFAEKLR